MMTPPWKDYLHTDCGTLTAGAIRHIVTSLRGKNSEHRDAADLIVWLQNEATELAKRSYVAQAKADALVVAADELRRQNTEMRRLIRMQEVRLRTVMNGEPDKVTVDG